MYNILFVVIALAVGFLLQIVWWRVRLPSLSSVLGLFATAFVVLSAVALYWHVLTLGFVDYARLALLYAAMVLSYTIVCTHAQTRSPALTIIKYIAGYQRDGGCPENKLVRHFLGLDAMADRLKLMEASDLIRFADGKCRLTNKGRFFARLFEFAAQFFGLPKGG